jgi:hypothetical protein
VGDADRWEIEDGAEVKGEAGAARVVAAGAVDEEDIWRVLEGAPCGFQQGAFAKG